MMSAPSKNKRHLNKHSKVSCLTVSDDAPRTERQRAWPKRDFSLFETMQYYVLWHTFAESYVEWSFRLEDAQHKVVDRDFFRAQTAASDFCLQP